MMARQTLLKPGPPPPGWISGIKGFVCLLGFLILAAPLVARVLAQDAAGAGQGVQMPDVKEMSGIPLPVGDLASGTVVVRLIRGSLDKAITDHPVELHAASGVVSSRTNDTGRAEFTGLEPGTRVRAVTTVAGERLESQEFAIPPVAGIRMLLVAADPEAQRGPAEDRELAAGPAQTGAVVLGEQTRFVFEAGEEGLTAFNLLQIVNAARVPVQPPEPLVFELPELATQPTILQGSSPQASLAGTRVTVNGPFAPGTTLVQIAYSIPFSRETVVVRQRMPAPLAQLTVLAQKVGDLRVVSPLLTQQREMATEGETYIVAQGPALRAGDVMTLELYGLPYASTWPTNLALVLAVVILAAGIWGAARTGRGVTGQEGRRRKLQARRDRVFADLAAIEEQHRAGGLDPQRYTARRRDLVSTLERLYAEMDEEAAA